MKLQETPRAVAMIESLEGRRMLSTSLNNVVGDPGTYIGSTVVKLTVDGQARRRAVKLTITSHNTKTGVVKGTMTVAKYAFKISGVLGDGGHVLSFGIQPAKKGAVIATGVYSGKIRKHLQVAEGRITLKFTQFSTNAVLDLSPNAPSTPGNGGSGSAAVPPPTVVTPPTGSTGNPVVSGGSLFG